MLTLNSLKPTKGSKKAAVRVGRGNGSGRGTYCGRGCNGQNCRSGGGVPSWFEGGQTPLFRRMPKLRGFSNHRFMKHYNVLNISDLAKLVDAGLTTINKDVLIENGLIAKKNLGVKVLGKGELKGKLTLTVNKISASAKDQIEKAGGKVDLV